MKRKTEKRGLSTIVISLIIILLSLVAVGIVSVVVNNLLKGGTEGISVSAKCLNIHIEATSVVCDGGDCAVALQRTGTENAEIAGVKLVFRDSTAGTSSSLIDESGNIEVLVGKAISSVATGLTDPDKLEVTPYFEDESGNEQICSTTSSYEF